MVENGDARDDSYPHCYANVFADFGNVHTRTLPKSYFKTVWQPRVIFICQCWARFLFGREAGGCVLYLRIKCFLFFLLLLLLFCSCCMELKVGGWSLTPDFQYTDGGWRTFNGHKLAILLLGSYYMDFEYIHIS